MTRQSTAIGRGGHYSFTCDKCWDGFSTLSARDWEEAERQAARKGWRLTGSGMSAREFCGRCA